MRIADRKHFDVEQAVNAAMIAFWAHGYPSTGIERLVRSTGVGKGSLYATFGSKDALFRQALDRYAAIYGAQYQRALGAEDPVAAIRGYLEVGFLRLEDPTVPAGCLLCQSVAGAAALDPASREHTRTLLARQTTRVSQTLTRLPEPAGTVEQLTQLVLALQQGAVVMHAAGTSVGELRATADIALRGLVNAPAAR